jgi:hypothetical protein
MTNQRTPLLILPLLLRASAGMVRLSPVLVERGS